MSAPLVSILIPCFNAERYIVSAIESALAQDYRNVEVVVIDDGSTDRSLDELRRFEHLRNFRYETGPNRGGNAARNRALELAKGEFVQFLDADDLLHPSKVRRCLAAMDAQTDAVVCDYVEQSSTGERIVRFPRVGTDLVEYFTITVIQTTIPFHRIRGLRAAGGFDESLPCCQEYEFHLRLARKVWRRVAQVSEPLCTVVKLDGSVSSNEARVFSHKVSILETAIRDLEAASAATRERREAIAKELYVCCRHLVRHGLDGQARAAYALARDTSPSTDFPARGPMRVLIKFLGPVRAEQLRMTLQRRYQSSRPVSR